MPEPVIHDHHDYLVGRFSAMASPCEILIDSMDRNLANHLATVAMKEALRIEGKFSRYRNDNIIYRINHANGKVIEVDDETASLLDYAEQCYNISQGLFDITSGVLRKIWKFDGSGNLANQQQIDDILNLVGWNKVSWKNPYITLPKGMEIDFGGIGKEYAVDQSVAQIAATSHIGCLINFGGDIRSTGPRSDGQPWVIGIESPDQVTEVQKTTPSIKLTKGAVATSGDAKRFLIKDGVRYSHVINPKTGWPITDGPRSVTVAANTCTEAGILATLAILHGRNAETFLKAENVDYWCEW